MPRDCVDLPYLKCIIFIPSLLFCVANCLLSCNLVNQSVLHCQDFVLLSKDFVEKQHPVTLLSFTKNTVHVIALMFGMCMCVLAGVLYVWAQSTL